MHPRYFGLDLQGHRSAGPDETFSNAPVDKVRWAFINELVNAVARCQ